MLLSQLRAILADLPGDLDVRLGPDEARAHVVELGRNALIISSVNENYAGVKVLYDETTEEPDPMDVPPRLQTLYGFYEQMTREERNELKQRN